MDTPLWRANVPRATFLKGPSGEKVVVLKAVFAAVFGGSSGDSSGLAREVIPIVPHGCSRLGACFLMGRAVVGSGPAVSRQSSVRPVNAVPKPWRCRHWVLLTPG
jgi:hypothetical protein